MATETKFDRAQTTIRPKALARVRAVIPYLRPQPRVTDFITQAADELTLKVCRKHGIKLPADVAFETPVEKQKQRQEASSEA